MTLRKLGWIVGGFGFFCLAATVILFGLALFTHVLDRTEEEVVYDCTACLRKDPTRCKTMKTDPSMPHVNSEETARQEAALNLCRDMMPEEGRRRPACFDWVYWRRDEMFDIRCASHIERRKRPWFTFPVH